MAEELVDECCSFESDIDDLYEKGKHRKKPVKFAPLTVPADIPEEELEKLSPETLALLGYNPHNSDCS
jgi:hypothetical protein